MEKFLPEDKKYPKKYITPGDLVMEVDDEYISNSDFTHNSCDVDVTDN